MQAGSDTVRCSYNTIITISSYSYTHLQLLIELYVYLV